MRKFKLILFDLFFVISGVIGVGFATGKEIAHFFVGGKNILLAVIIFFCIFAGLSIYILHIKNKHKITNLNQLNKFAFGKYYELGNIVLIVLFIVTNSAMLAGCDNIMRNVFNLNVPVISLFLSLITFFIVLGGINRIKYIANVIMPALIIIIIINSCFNFNSQIIYNGNMVNDFIYPIIFCSENFITLISVLINTKSKPSVLGVSSSIIISVIVLLSAMSIGVVNADMPMLALSKNLGNVFYVVYLLGIIFALFTTLEISTYHCLQVSIKSNRQKHFILSLILLTSQIIAYLGFNFIVKYLYTAIGILGAVYLIMLIIKLLIENKKFK